MTMKKTIAVVRTVSSCGEKALPGERTPEKADQQRADDTEGRRFDGRRQPCIGYR